MTTILPVSEHELRVVRELALAIWPDTYGSILSAAQLDYMLEKIYSLEALAKSQAAGQHYVLLYDQGTPIGFAAYQHGYGNEPVTRIHKIYVLPHTQGKGYGKLLLGYMEQLGVEAQSARLSLNVNRFNSAQYFYQKMGFEVVLTEDIAIGQGYLMEDYRMEKVL